MVTTPNNRTAGGLHKVLGVLFGTLMIVSGTIGSGILRTPGDVAAQLPSPAWYVGVWVAGGLYALCGAMTMAELAAMLPKSGGQYVFARRAFGEYGGFVIGWTDWISCAASVAAISITLGELMNELWPALPLSANMIAITTTLAFGVIHWVGVRSGDTSTQLLGSLKVLSLVAVAAVCFAAPDPQPGGVSPAFPSGLAVGGALVIAMQSVLYSFDGWTGVVYFSGEVKEPKMLPRAMAFGVITVTAIYLLLAVSFLSALGIPELAGSKFAGKLAAAAAFGPAGERFVSAVIALSAIGAIGAILMQTSRVPFAMAEDGLLPRIVARVNKGGTPDIALLGSVGVSVLLIATGTFNSVLALAAFFYVMQYGVSFASLFALRRKEPDAPRPYRAIGYPFIPAMVLLGAVAFIGGNFLGDLKNTLISVGVIALSYPVFLLVARMRRSA